MRMGKDCLERRKLGCSEFDPLIASVDDDRESGLDPEQQQIPILLQRNPFIPEKLRVLVVWDQGQPHLREQSLPALDREKR